MYSEKAPRTEEPDISDWETAMLMTHSKRARARLGDAFRQHCTAGCIAKDNRVTI